MSDSFNEYLDKLSKERAAAIIELLKEHGFVVTTQEKLDAMWRKIERKVNAIEALGFTWDEQKGEWTLPELTKMLDLPQDFKNLFRDL